MKKIIYYSSFLIFLGLALVRAAESKPYIYLSWTDFLTDAGKYAYSDFELNECGGTLQVTRTNTGIHSASTTIVILGSINCNKIIVEGRNVGIIEKAEPIEYEMIQSNDGTWNKAFTLPKGRYKSPVKLKILNTQTNIGTKIAIDLLGAKEQRTKRPIWMGGNNYVTPSIFQQLMQYWSNTLISQ